MSYCVNCGVELVESEKSCPLCGVEVNNPNKPWAEPKEYPYPHRIDEILKGVNNRFIGRIIALIFAIPILICCLNDLLLNGALTWSLYVIGGIALLYFIFILPFAMKNRNMMLLIALDTLAVIGFLFLVELVKDSRINWSLWLGLPITFILGAIIEMYVAWYAKGAEKRPILLVVGLAIFFAGVYTACLDILIKLYQHADVFIGWSLYVLCPCTIIYIFMALINRQQRWKESVRKRLFF